MHDTAPDLDDRGVTEVVGFVLVFSLVVMTIGFVYTGGLSGLEDARDAEQVNNAERAFDVLSNNFEKMARNEAPNRATEIKLAGSELAVRDSQRVSVNTTETEAYRGYPIYFSTGVDTHIVYEHGAVIRDQPDGAVMLHEPDYVFGEERTVFRYAEIRGGTQSISGETTVLLRAEITLRDVDVVDTDHDNVTVTLNTSTRRADAWMRYFESALDGLAVAGSGDPCSRDDYGSDHTTITCEFQTDRVHVAKTRIRVSIVG